METIGGYRLVRQLGEGPRAIVHLARLDGEDDGLAGVVVKEYRPGIAEVSVSTEIEALARGVSDHTVALLDVATAPTGEFALILGRLSGGSLARLLARRQAISTGEAVGILRSVISAVDGLHRAGVAHGRLRADALLFDADGAAVLACFGHATLLEPALPPALLDAEPGVQHDRLALAGLVAAVLDHVDDREAVHPVHEWLTTVAPASDWPAGLAQRLSALAEPAPVDVRAPTGREVVAAAIPGRLPVGTIEPWRPGAVERLPARRALRSDGPAAGFVRGMIGGELIDRAVGQLRAVRARVWVLAGAGAVAMLAAAIFIAATEGVGRADPAEVAPVAASPTPTAKPEQEPDAAVAQLLTERERCLRDRSVLCLDNVASPGSAALAHDQELVLALQGGAEAPAPFVVSTEQVSVQERLGDAVLVSLDGVDEDQPSSILLTRVDGRWTFRDYLDR